MPILYCDCTVGYLYNFCRNCTIKLYFQCNVKPQLLPCDLQIDATVDTVDAKVPKISYSHLICMQTRIIDFGADHNSLHLGLFVTKFD